MANRNSADPPSSPVALWFIAGRKEAPSFYLVKRMYKNYPEYYFTKLFFWDMTPYLLVIFVGFLEKVAVSIVTEIDFSEDGGCRLRRNVRYHLPITTASYHKRLCSTPTTLWKSHIRVYVSSLRVWKFSFEMLEPMCQTARCHIPEYYSM